MPVTVFGKIENVSRNRENGHCVAVSGEHPAGSDCGHIEVLEDRHGATARDRMENIGGLANQTLKDQGSQGSGSHCICSEECAY